MAERLTEIRTNLVERVALGNNVNTSIRIPCEYGIVAFRFRLSASLGAADSTIMFDGALANLVSRLTLRANGHVIWDLAPREQLRRMQFFKGTAGAATAAAVAGAAAAANLAFEVPCSLPRHVLYPDRHATMLPAGLMNNLSLQVVCPSVLYSAVYADGTLAAPTSPLLEVSVISMVLANEELKRTVLASGHGYVQQQFSGVGATSSDADINLPAGEGALVDLFARTRDNAAVGVASGDRGSNTLVTGQRLILGGNTFPLDSRFLLLQDDAKEFFNVETSPAGSWAYTFQRDGQFDQGVSLVGRADLKLRGSYGTVTGVGDTSIITGIIIPNLYQALVGPSILKS